MRKRMSGLKRIAANNKRRAKVEVISFLSGVKKNDKKW